MVASQRIRTRLAIRTRLRSWLELPPPVLEAGYTGWHDSSRITMGRHTYGDPQVITYDDNSGGRVELGSFCSVAAHVRFLVDGEHRHDIVTTSPLQAFSRQGPFGHNRSKGLTVVGHDVWIGRDAFIMSGVNIGTGAVIAAKSVVVKDVKPYAIVGGNPAREIRRRFPDEICDALLSSCWWDWPDDRIRESAHLLHGPPEDFLAAQLT